MTDDTTRHAMRRQALLSPFLILGVLGVSAILLGAWVAVGFIKAPGIIIVTRHVEKAAIPADNPGPSEIGQRRAEQLAEMFGGSGVDAVFATHYLRSFATATPLAHRLAMPVHVYDAADTDAMLARINAEHRYETVFVVGHSNTVPAIVRTLSGKRVADIDEDRYGDIFLIVRPRWGRTVLIHYRMPAPSA